MTNEVKGETEMKSVLISIRPQWCEKIASGEKTIEVRKSAPKEVPFKAYIYCSKEKKQDDIIWAGAFGDRGKWNGNVIGEFICDKVMFLTPLGLRGFEMREEILKSICLTNDDLNAYGGLKTLYGWHISDLKIYDKPKELSEFKPICKFEGKDAICALFCPNWKYNGGLFFECTRKVDRPPQSYMFVEEV